MHHLSSLMFSPYLFMIISGSGFVSAIPELVGRNYKEWRNQLECALTLLEYDDVLTTPFPANINYT
jgi:hypothetical protein